MNNLLVAAVTSLSLLSQPAQEAAAPRDQQGDKLPVEELVKRVRASLATIRVENRDGDQQGIGTAFVVSSDGLLATNLHVIGEGRSFVVELPDGRKPKVLAVEASDHALDLAVIRVAVDPENPLQPLPLSDQRPAQGTPVIAMGNPWGLENSVVSGLVSALRKIRGRELLQLAMPIEFGNSGGPVVDSGGRVVGIVSLKSAVEQNVGFAVQVQALRSLLDKPNPIPFERWSNLGVVDPERWHPLFGSRWREHGGRISVTGSGGGFGGRSLCLAEVEVPPAPFELAVTVRLDHEAGAAGLVFHSDGKHRHYGFYPSNGKLRLTCFDGPTVFSWRILAEEASEHYRHGDWNELSVRVENGRLLCFINGHLVIESNDGSFDSGRVGLAKFRQTEAEFRRFRVGAELASEHVTAEAMQQAAQSIDGLPPLQDVGDEQLVQISRAATASIAVLRKRASELEKRAGRLQSQAAQLRRLASDVNLHTAAREFAELIAEDQFDLLRAALLLARFEDPDLDVDAYVAQATSMAERVQESLAEDATEADRLSALHKFLFAEWGYHGSRFEYYDRANSFMNRVIDDREGLPITLATLYMDLAAKLGLTVEGVGLPGHFVVRFVPAEGEPQMVDVYNRGAFITRQQAEELVRDLGGQPLTDDHLRPAARTEILARMLRNLWKVVVEEEDKEAMLRILEALLILEPAAADYRSFRAAIRAETGRRAAAVADLDWLLEHQPTGVDLNQIRRMREFLQR